MVFKPVSTRRWSIGWACLALLTAALSCPAAVFVIEQFDADPNWVDRDTDEMQVAWNSSFGYLGSGSMQGSFALQTGTPSPETDAMRIINTSSGGGFSGNYFSAYPAFLPDTASLTFRFYSDDVLPSDLRIRIGSGAFTFSRSVASQASALDSWQTVTVDLGYAGWLGGTAAQYSNAFTAVSFIDIQISRSGTNSQSFFVDNFALNGDDNNPVDPVDAVPEAATTQFLLLGMIFMAGGVRSRFRKMLRGNRTMS